MESSSLSTVNQAWSGDKSRVGFQLLLKMGWQEGLGLGIEKQGIPQAVKIQKKLDSSGIGSSQFDSNKHITAAVSDTYNQVLSKLAHIGEQPVVLPESNATSGTTRRKSEKKLSYYERRVKSKKVGTYSSEHLKEIFGGVVMKSEGEGEKKNKTCEEAKNAGKEKDKREKKELKKQKKLKNLLQPKKEKKSKSKKNKKSIK